MSFTWLDVAPTSLLLQVCIQSSGFLGPLCGDQSRSRKWPMFECQVPCTATGLLTLVFVPGTTTTLVNVYAVCNAITLLENG